MLQREESENPNVRRSPTWAASRQTLKRPALIALRAHPSMLYRGAPNWPPLWTQSGRHGNKTARGELGVLRRVSGDQRSTERFYLVIEQEGERYVGAMRFDDPVFGWLIAKVLRSHLGWPIREIGDLDLSFSLPETQAVAAENPMKAHTLEGEVSRSQL